MSFSFDSKGSNTLTNDAISPAGTFSGDSKSSGEITWGLDFRTWAQETRTWAQMATLYTLDTKH